MKHLKCLAPGLTSLFMLTSCQSRSSTENESKTIVEAWEYMEFRAPSHSFAKDELNQLGAEGWEVVEVTRDQPSTPLFFLKRKLSNQNKTEVERAAP